MCFSLGGGGDKFVGLGQDRLVFLMFFFFFFFSCTHGQTLWGN